jgi:hypothetical protein
MTAVTTHQRAVEAALAAHQRLVQARHRHQKAVEACLPGGLLAGLAATEAKAEREYKAALEHADAASLAAQQEAAR